MRKVSDATSGRAAPAQRCSLRCQALRLLLVVFFSEGQTSDSPGVPSEADLLLEGQGRAEEAAQTKHRQHEVSFLTVQLSFLLKERIHQH